MQKSDSRASILIWTIFLSIIVSMAFLGISTKIHKNIKNSGDFITTLDIQNQIQNYIASGSISKTYINKYFGDTISLEFEDQYSLSRSFRKNGSTEFKFLEDSGSALSMTIDEGGPLEYRWSQTSQADDIGFIVSTSSLNIVGTGSLFIKNLAGNTRLTLSSSNTLITPAQTHYKIFRKIGNLKSIQSESVIDNFLPGDF